MKRARTKITVTLLLAVSMLCFMFGIQLLSGKGVSAAENSQTLPVLGFSGSNSSAEYMDQLESYYEEYDLKSGVHLELAEGETFTFGKPIDLGATPEFINFNPYINYALDTPTPNRPNGGHAYEINAMRQVLRLTDYMDPDNYIEIVIDIIDANPANNPYFYRTYMRAGVAGDMTAGLEPGTSSSSAAGGTVVIDGTTYTIYYGDGIGDFDYGSMGKTAHTYAQYEYYYLFKFDVSTNQLLFKCDYTDIPNGDWTLMNDLDNTDINELAFSGFTDNKAYLSVRAEQYVESNTQSPFEIAQIGSYSGSDFQPFTEGSFTGASVVLADDFGVKFIAEIPVEQNAAAAHVEFVSGDSETVSASLTGTGTEGEYYARYDGITPQKVGDEITATLYFGNTVMDTQTYSVKQYCENMIAEPTTSQELKDLLGSVLIYGAAAQQYTGYNTDNLVAEIPVLTAPADTDRNITEASSADLYFYSAGMHFDSVNGFYVKIFAQDISSVSLAIGETEYTAEDFSETGDENIYILYTDGIFAKDYATTFTFELKSDAQTVQTLTYSIKAYAYAMAGSSNANMSALATAVYNYGIAAVQYVQTQEV